MKAVRSDWTLRAAARFVKVALKSLTLTTAVALSLSSVANAADRHKWFWPFASDSIWNTAIGSHATYTPATINGTPIGGFSGEYLDYDHEYHIRTRADHPVRNLYYPKDWCDRIGGTTQAWIPTMRIPDWYKPVSTRCNPYDYYTPNNLAVFLQPNGNDVIQIEPADRATSTGPVYGYPQSSEFMPEMKLDNQGERGVHYGSGLSALGGSLRLGDLVGTQPIRHALKVNLWGSRYLYRGVGNGAGAGWGYRWPAANADGNAPNEIASNGYGGTNPDLAQGSLLAIPPGFSPESLGLESVVGRKLFAALQNYGAYVVDDTGWHAIHFAGEDGVPEEVEATYGMSMKGDFGSNAITRDLKKLFNNLHIVTNNSPATKGGGGVQRAALPVPSIAAGDRVKNFDFENSSESPWIKYGNATAAIGYGRYGSKGIRIGPASAYEQVITGLMPNTTYTLWGAARVASRGQKVFIGVKNFGGNLPVATQVSSTSYTRRSVTFRTGANNTSAKIFFHKNSSMAGYAYGDEFSVTQGGTGANLITNPSFEADQASTQTITHWSESGNPESSYVGPNQGGQSGAYYGVHYSGSPYQTYTHQTRTNLLNGPFTLTAWVKSSGGQTTAQMDVRNYGGTDRSVPIPASSNWTKVTIPNINITNGQITIGFYSDSPGGNWIQFDDVTLTRE